MEEENQATADQTLWNAAINLHRNLARETAAMRGEQPDTPDAAAARRAYAEQVANRPEMRWHAENAVDHLIREAAGRIRANGAFAIHRTADGERRTTRGAENIGHAINLVGFTAVDMTVRQFGRVDHNVTIGGRRNYLVLFSHGGEYIGYDTISSRWLYGTDGNLGGDASHLNYDDAARMIVRIMSRMTNTVADPGPRRATNQPGVWAETGRLERDRLNQYEEERHVLRDSIHAEEGQPRMLVEQVLTYDGGRQLAVGRPTMYYDDLARAARDEVYRAAPF